MNCVANMRTGRGESNSSQSLLQRASDLLQPREVGKGMIIGRAAHLKRGAQVIAHDGTVGLAKYLAAVVGGQLHAAHARRFAVGHAGDRRGNREFDATCAATDATIHLTPRRAAARVPSGR